ncbi:MAG: AMP-binding protein, partial [Parafilimonas terrae]|nr:AMP-binding protein [Parafilimonas terrae]
MSDSLPSDRHPPARFNAARYCLAENARLRPGKTALIMVGDDTADRLTFGDVERAVRGIAAGLLGLGLKPSDRVMIRMGNEADYVLVYFGALAAGLVALPSSPQLTEGEAAFLMENFGAAAVVVGSGCTVSPEALGDRLLLDAGAITALKAGPPLPDYADTAADDPAVLIYTSGTTSRPKGVLHAHRAAYGRRPMLVHWLGLSESDVMLHAGTMNWTYTLGVVLSDPWSVGATAVLY